MDMDEFRRLAGLPKQELDEARRMDKEEPRDWSSAGRIKQEKQMKASFESTDKLLGWADKNIAKQRKELDRLTEDVARARDQFDKVRKDPKRSGMDLVNLTQALGRLGNAKIVPWATIRPVIAKFEAWASHVMRHKDRSPIRQD